MDTCEIYNQNAQPTLSIRTRAAVQDLPTLIGQSYAAIGAHMKKHGVQPSGMPYTAYFNMDMQDLDVEIGFPVDRVVSGEGPIQPGEMPEGMYASLLYRGLYSEMGPAYETLKLFIEKSGYKPQGAAYEFYLNSPEEVAMEDLETRIVLPIEVKNE